MRAYLITILITFSLFFSQESYWINSKLKKMTLEEKVGQLLMIPINIDFLSANSEDYITVTESIKKYGVGGLILFNGEIYSTAVQVNEFQKLSKEPLFIAADFERGIFQQMPDGIQFPPNMAVAATHNSQYAFWQGKITGIEARAIGVNFIFAPVLDVNNNPDNPIINFRSYGDNPHLVSLMGNAFISGLQSQQLIATAKHFPGHGDTHVDSHSGIPIINIDETRLDSIELLPFKEAIKQNVKAIMTAHISIPKLTNGQIIPATLSENILTGILRKKLNFNGIVVSDAFNMKGVNPEGKSEASLIQAVNAGVDIILMPIQAKFAHRSLVKAVLENKISLKRLNESVRRILKAKYEIGLYEKRIVEIETLKHHINKDEFVSIANQMAQDGISWIKQTDFRLPLKKQEHITLISLSSDLTLENPGQYFIKKMKVFYPKFNNIILDYRSDTLLIEKYKSELKSSDKVIVAIYSRTKANNEYIGINPKEMMLLDRVLKAYVKPILILSFSSPYIHRHFSEYLNHMTAFSYSELMQENCAIVLGQNKDIKGQIPIEIPQIAYFRENFWMQEKESNWNPLDSLINKAIADSTFPGTSIAIGNSKGILYQKAYGRLTYNLNSDSVSIETVYDLASLTKIFATTFVCMRLVDKNLLNMDDKVSDILNHYKNTDKAGITIRQLLTHSSGILWHKNLFEIVKTKKEMYRKIWQEPLATLPQTEEKYSDLAIILLMEIIETIYDRDFEEIFKIEISEKLHLKNTYYRPPNEIKMKIPPTEKVAWRGYLAQGEVHDENAMSMGAVSTHAGLFSNSSDLSIFCEIILNEGLYQGNRYIQAHTVKEFSRKQSLVKGSDRALGWDKPSSNSFAGDFVSAESVIHTGFTGTSVVIDPVNDVFILHLSNRVYPSRQNIKIRKFRKDFHNTVMKILGFNKKRD